MAAFLNDQSQCSDSEDDNDVADQLSEGERALFTAFIDDSVIHDEDDDNDDGDDYVYPNPHLRWSGSDVNHYSISGDYDYDEIRNQSDDGDDNNDDYGGDDDDGNDNDDGDDDVDREVRGSKRSAEKGNGVSPSKGSQKKTCTTRAIQWCFTLNNYTVDEYDGLLGLYPENVEYIIIGKEIATTTGTPHLQGYFKLTERKRFNQVKDLCNTVRISLYACKGTAQQNIDYCSKDGDFEERGARPVKEPKKQKMQRIISHLMGGGSKKELVDSDLCHVYVTNRRKIESTIAEIQDEEKRISMTENVRRQLNLCNYKEWEETVIEMMNSQYNQSDKRTINWFCDRKGGVGKTEFIEKIRLRSDDVISFRDDPAPEVKYIYNGQKMVYFDIPRNAYVNYCLIETIKDGMFISTKYEPKVKFCKRPSVAVFSNIFPDVTKLSMDRWNIYEFEHNDTVVRLVHKSAYSFV